MTDAFTIRRANPADAPAVARLADALSINEGDPTGHFNEQAIRRDCFGSKPALMLWVAETGTTLIGYASAHTAYESAWAARGWHLADLYVIPEARRQGVARALMEAVAIACRSEGGAYLWWTSKPENAEAHRFYASVGASTEPLQTHWLDVARTDP